MTRSVAQRKVIYPIPVESWLQKHQEAVRYFSLLVTDLKTGGILQPITRQRLKEAKRHLDDIAACPKSMEHLHKWSYSHYFSEAGNQYYICLTCREVVGFYTGALSSFPITMAHLHPGQVLVTAAPAWQPCRNPTPPQVQFID